MTNAAGDSYSLFQTQQSPCNVNLNAWICAQCGAVNSLLISSYLQCGKKEGSTATSKPLGNVNLAGNRIEIGLFVVFHVRSGLRNPISAPFEKPLSFSSRSIGLDISSVKKTHRAGVRGLQCIHSFHPRML